MSDWLYERDVKKIADFEKCLDDSRDIGIRVGGYPSSDKYYLTDLSYWNQNLIFISGYSENDDPIELVHNMYQFHIILISIIDRLGSGKHRI